jgi:hypothetical protein
MAVGRDVFSHQRSFNRYFMKEIIKKSQVNNEVFEYRILFDPEPITIILDHPHSFTGTSQLLVVFVPQGKHTEFLKNNKNENIYLALFETTYTEDDFELLVTGVDRMFQLQQEAVQEIQQRDKK